MKRALLAIVTLTACSAPAPAYRAGPAATTSTTRSSEGAGLRGDTRPAPSGPTLPPPSTIAVPVSPPHNPPELEAPARSARSGGTTTASWYGDESGSHTATGERYDPDGLTFAHRTMPFGTAVRFCRNGSCVVATCGDRGPAAWTGRDFDLSRATFAQLAPLSAGVASVTWERLA